MSTSEMPHPTAQYVPRYNEPQKLDLKLKYNCTAYVKSELDKKGKISKIGVTKPHQGEFSHAKYINNYC